MPYPEYTKEELDEFRKNNPMLTWGMPSWDCIKYMKKEYEEANRKEPAKTEEARIESEKKVEEKASESGILKYVTTAQVSATNKFVVRDYIQSANIGWTGPHFKKHFLKKTEKRVPAGELVISELKKDSLDAPIMAELGDKVETKLAHFIELLERQSNGQKGTLFINGCANVAYIKDDEGTFWAVDAYLDNDDQVWNVEAYSVEIPSRWYAGYRVLSCK